NKIFSDKEQASGVVHSDSLSLAGDPFLNTREYEQYTYFAQIRDRLQYFTLAGKGETLTDVEVDSFIRSNEDSFLTYFYLGNYFARLKEWEKAATFYKIGLTNEVARTSERKHMKEALAKSLAEIKK